eukprot:SM000018S03733  [mRNA]  locus=s18:1117822:1119242:- [translate_table: standard]
MAPPPSPPLLDDGAVAAAPAATAPPAAAPYAQGDVIMHSLGLIDSYFRATERQLFAEPIELSQAARALWDAPFVVVSHGTEDDPIFNYGNRAALDLFGLDWPAFTSLPSRKSAGDDAANIADRQQWLDAAQKAAVNLAGQRRFSSTGREFEIKEGTYWTLTTLDGEVFGQAAVFKEWEYVDTKEQPEADIG